MLSCNPRSYERQEVHKEGASPCIDLSLTSRWVRCKFRLKRPRREQRPLRPGSVWNSWADRRWRNDFLEKK